MIHVSATPGPYELGQTGGEVVDLLGRLRGGLNGARRSRLIELFELDPTKKCGTYSTGNRQKVALVAALASDVELLLLDEPTLGLDPLMEASFRQVIMEEKKQGRTVLLSSHILAEVEALCDRVTIIRSGRAVETGTLAELRHLTFTTIIAELVGGAQVDLSSIPGICGLEMKGTSLHCEVDSTGITELLRRLSQAGIRSLVSQPPTLEELFMHYYGAAKAEAPEAAK